MASRSITALPLLGCLAKIEKEIGIGADWIGVNNVQREFLQLFYGPGISDVERCSSNELLSLASRTADGINRFLAEEGFDIRLTPWYDSSLFGIAAIFRLLVSWVRQGKKSKILCGDKEFPAVLYNDGSGFSVYKSLVTGEPILVMKTQEGDTVAMTVLDGDQIKHIEASQFGLLSLVNSIQTSKWQKFENFEMVLFPMIDYNEQIDVSWFGSMSYMNFWIEEAIQQTKFQMNEFGAKVESAAAMSTRGIVSMQDCLVIDKPFLVWVERKGFVMPVFMGFMDTDCWKSA